MQEKKFSFSVEDLQEDIVIEDESEAPELFDDEEIEGGDSVDVYEEAVDKVEDVVDGLEAIRERMVETLAIGGMTKEAADFAQMAISATAQRWVKVTAMPGMEGLADAEARLTATNFAIEGLGDMIKQSFAKITSLVKGWFKATGEFFHKLFITVRDIEKDAEKLAKLAAAHTGKPKAGTVSLSTAEYTNLLVDEKADDVKGALDAVTKLINELTEESQLGEVLLTTSQELEKISKLAKDQAIKEYKNIVKTFELDAIVSKFEKLSKLKYKTSTDPRYKNTDDVKYLVLVDKLVGDKTIIVKFSGNANGLLTDIEAITEDSSARFPNDSYELKALTAAEIEALAKAINKAADAIIRCKMDVSKREKLADDILFDNWQISSNLESRLNGLTDVEFREETYYHDMVQYLKAYSSSTESAASAMMVMQPDMDIIRQAVSTLKAAYNYAVKCYDNLQEEVA